MSILESQEIDPIFEVLVNDIEIQKDDESCSECLINFFAPLFVYSSILILFVFVGIVFIFWVLAFVGFFPYSLYFTLIVIILILIFSVPILAVYLCNYFARHYTNFNNISYDIIS